MKLISRVVFVNKTSVFNNNHSTFYNLYTNISGQSIWYVYKTNCIVTVSTICLSLVQTHWINEINAIANFSNRFTLYQSKNSFKFYSSLIQYNSVESILYYIIFEINVLEIFPEFMYLFFHIKIYYSNSYKL